MNIEQELAMQIGFLTIEVIKRETIIVAQRAEIAGRDETIRTLRIELEAVKAPKPHPRVLSDEEHLNGGPH